MASAYIYVSPNTRERYIPANERARSFPLRPIVDAIPPSRLAIQVGRLPEAPHRGGFFPDRLADYEARIVTALARLGNAEPPDVEIGDQPCHGSPADEHLVMPRDMAVMVGMANVARGALARRLDFLHMPVPKDRTDAAYFALLAALEGAEQRERAFRRR